MSFKICTETHEESSKKTVDIELRGKKDSKPTLRLDISPNTIVIHAVKNSEL